MTYTTTSPVVPKPIRASVSFFAMFMGWGASILAFALVSSLSRGRVTDFGFTVSWSALFHLVTWGAVVLPLVLVLDPRRLLFHPVIFPFVGAIVAVIAAPIGA